MMGHCLLKGVETRGLGFSQVARGDHFTGFPTRDAGTSSRVVILIQSVFSLTSPIPMLPI